MKHRFRGSRIFAMVLAGGLLMGSAGCEHVSEPWVRQPDQLKQERSRPPQARLELKNRLLAVQTDR